MFSSHPTMTIAIGHAFIMTCRMTRMDPLPLLWSRLLWTHSLLEGRLLLWIEVVSVAFLAIHGFFLCVPLLVFLIACWFDFLVALLSPSVPSVV